jgi:UMF1 family MFS transporter
MNAQSTAGGRPEATAAGRRQIMYWCMYDWANSAYGAVVLSFVFAPYFLTNVADDPVHGQAQWGFAISTSALCVAILSPVLGALADQSGRRRTWLASCTLAAIVTTSAMWWVKPEPAYQMLALILLATSNVGFELGYVFYNSLLSDVSSDKIKGRVSGMGFAAGYFGGLLSLALVNWLFVVPDPLIQGLDKAASEPARLSSPVAALWFLVFSSPLILLGPKQHPSRESTTEIVRKGLIDLWQTIRDLPKTPSIAWLLVAHMFFQDGLNSIFVFGPLVAKGAFGFSDVLMLQFGVAINVAAGIGALAFGWIDDRIGAKPVILVSIVSLATVSVSVVLLQSQMAFFFAACILGTFFGPLQASGRSLMSRLAPAEMTTKYFGLYALAGRATGPFGALLIGWTTLQTGNQKAGIAVIAVWFLIGFLLMLPVREPKKPGCAAKGD